MQCCTLFLEKINCKKIEKWLFKTRSAMQNLTVSIVLFMFYIRQLIVSDIKFGFVKDV